MSTTTDTDKTSTETAANNNVAAQADPNAAAEAASNTGTAGATDAASGTDTANEKGCAEVPAVHGVLESIKEELDTFLQDGEKDAAAIIAWLKTKF